MDFVSVNNTALHYEIIGQGSDKPVLVFSNSLGTDYRIWDAVVGELSEDFTIVRYDKRGHGLSDIANPPYNMQDHMDDLAGLLDHFGFSKVILCGLSVGGMIAQGLYTTRPDLIGALVLCDTGHKIGTAEMWQERIDALNEDGLSSMVDAVMERWFTKPFRNKDNPAFNGCVAMLSRQDEQGYIGTCAAIRDTDWTEAAKTIDVPTLCVVGDQDLATPPELVKELSSLIPGAIYREIAGAGHIPCIEQPQILVDEMKAFFVTNNIGCAANG
ncbi:MAG: 3-oxoadipate enol-lactonase [Sneathiella sp.]|nr:3-oxoadipate enol-lactonase [Sneathiella sp.]